MRERDGLESRGRTVRCEPTLSYNRGCETKPEERGVFRDVSCTKVLSPKLCCVRSYYPLASVRLPFRVANHFSSLAVLAENTLTALSHPQTLEDSGLNNLLDDSSLAESSVSVT